MELRKKANQTPGAFPGDPLDVLNVVDLLGGVAASE